jgi:hypothetical protein
MNAERPLVEWARRMQTTCPGNQQVLRQKLEATLVPMIRCALRTGSGQPPLVHWVQHQLPLLGGNDEERGDPSRLAGPLARVLCDRLLARLDPMPGRDTVTGP